ncbi:MAG TPA: hypothetical protein VMN03_05535 [Burkholderiales bacterium]|nr:hypothetical protein [Burkholderiales bacterium]
MALGVTPAPPLDVFVTSDVDFLGSKAVAKELAERLHAELMLPSADDPVQVNSAMLVLRDARAGTVLVDFLNEVMGVESSKVKQRAQEVEAFGTTFLVMHPVDCLASRIANLQSLPQKRNEFGIAQARLSIEIVRRFIEKVARDGNVRHALDLSEFVGRLARGRAAAQVSGEFAIDVLAAIPVNALPRAFVEKQWPHLVSRAARKAKPYAKRGKPPSGG